jgi:hypothetical protein
VDALREMEVQDDGKARMSALLCLVAAGLKPVGAAGGGEEGGGGAGGSSTPLDPRGEGSATHRLNRLRGWDAS